MGIAEVKRIAAELGAQSRCVVSRPEFVARQVDLKVVRHLVSCGVWRRLWPGMYYCASGLVTPQVRAHAAIKHAAYHRAGTLEQPRPVVTGLAGCLALGMRWVPEHARVQVLVGPNVQRLSNEHVLLRRTWDVEAVETWVWAGLHVADAGRLVVDGSRECGSLRDVRGLVLGAVADGMTDAGELRGLLNRGATAKTAWVRRAVRDAERGAASPPEAEVADGLSGRGWPYVLNAELRLNGVFLGISDGYLLGTGVGYEVDSVEWHGDSARMSATLQRHERFNVGVLSLVHVTPAAYRADPGDFHRRVADAVRARAARGLGEPEGLTVVHQGPILR